MQNFQASKPLVTVALQRIEELLQKKPADWISALSAPLTSLFYNAPSIDFEVIALALYECEEHYGILVDPPAMWSNMQNMQFDHGTLPLTVAVVKKREERKKQAEKN